MGVHDTCNPGTVSRGFTPSDETGTDCRTTTRSARLVGCLLSFVIVLSTTVLTIGPAVAGAVSLSVCAKGEQVRPVESTWSIGPMESELTRGEISDLAEDVDGYLWMAGDDLMIHTGRIEPTIIDAFSDEGDLVATINSLVPDPESGMWFADGGLKYFDLWTNSLVDTGIRADAIALAQNGLWVVTPKTVRYFDFANRSLGAPVSLTLDETGTIPGSIASDEQGNLYLADKTRMVTVTPSLEALERTVTGSFLTMTRSADGGIWYTSTAGLWRFEGPASPITLVAGCVPPALNNAAPGHVLAELSNGTLVAGASRDGLALFDIDNGEWLLDGFANEDPLNKVYTVVEDSRHRVWAATEREGLVRIHATPTRFGALYLPGIPSDVSVEIGGLSYADDSLWVAARTDGLFRYLVNTNSWSTDNSISASRTSENTSGRDSDLVDLPINVSAVSATPSKLLVGTWGRGLVRLNPDGSGILPDYPTQSSYVQAVEQLSEGYELVSNWSGGVYVFDERGRRTTRYLRGNRIISLSAITFQRSSRALAEYDNLLFFAGPSGLQIVDLLSGAVEYYSKTNERLSTDLINDIWVENRSVVWVASTVGLERLNLDTGVSEPLNEINGMPHLAVNAIHPHSSGRSLWVGTSDGLASVDLATGSVQAIFHEEDGLPSDNFTVGTSTTDDEGRVYMSTDRGIAVLPAEIVTPSFTGERLRVRCSLGCGTHYDGQTVQAAGPVEFEYVSNDYDSRGAPIIEFRLFGYSSNWIRLPPHRHSLYYPSLPRGSTTFAVRQLQPAALPSLSGGNDRESVLTLSAIDVAVIVPWWSRTRSRVLVAVSLVGLIALYLAIRERNRRVGQRLLEVTIQERTRELELSRADAEFANQAKDRFLRAFSHDLRSPLNGVIGYADLLEETPLSAKQTRYAEGIRAAGNQLSKMVEDLVASSRDPSIGQPAPATPTSLTTLLNQATQYLETSAGLRGVTLTWELAVHEDMVLINKRALRHVLINLMANAIVHSKATRVSISVDQIPSDDEFVNLYRFNVIDNGGLLEPDDVPRLLEPGQRGHNTTSSGSGLGLTMCRDWVSSHGSQLEVSVIPGVSTTFSFVLEIPRPSQTRNGQVSSKPTVVIVDDETFTRDSLNDMLTEMGCSVRACASAHDVLAVLAQERCDLVATDVMMNPTGGIDLARLIRGRFASPPIVAITGVPKAAEASGVFDLILAKPVSLRDLKQALDLIEPCQESRSEK